MPRRNRKPRKKLIRTMDLIKPITLEMLGSNEDPCFGKLYSPKASECSRCGDSEICAIAMGALSHVKRKKIEEEQAFKDIEEKDIKNDKRKKRRSLVRKKLIQVVKDSKGIFGEDLIITIYSDFKHWGYTKPKINKILDSLVKQGKIIKNKNLYYGNKNTR